MTRVLGWTRSTSTSKSKASGQECPLHTIKIHFELAAPDALLGVEGGEHYGFVVDAGGVAVDGGGGLGAEVAVAGIEVESGDVVSAVGAGELHASLDARYGVEAFHIFECSCWRREAIGTRGARRR
jgi:hypothetical protein